MPNRRRGSALRAWWTMLRTVFKRRGRDALIWDQQVRRWRGPTNEARESTTWTAPWGRGEIILPGTFDFGARVVVRDSGRRAREATYLGRYDGDGLLTVAPRHAVERDSGWISAGHAAVRPAESAET